MPGYTCAFSQPMNRSANTEFINGLAHLQARHLACVATIGSFDGVHLGHQALLQKVVSIASEAGLPSLVMVFEPQPNEYFSRERVPARLMRLREKVHALFNAGIDRVLCVRFNESFRSLTADAFIQRVLCEGIGVKHLIIGDDFRFGCDRAGDFSLLVERGKHLGFKVEDTSSQQSDGERISSTRIRGLLEQDRFAEAAVLLGRDYNVCGRVIYGKQLGRTINIPTANIGLGHFRSPVQGVYAVKLKVGENIYPSVANVGVKPTLGGSGRPVLEVHAIEQNLDIYGEFVNVSFYHKIRKEKQFDSLKELQTQIEKDIEAATVYLSK